MVAANPEDFLAYLAVAEILRSSGKEAEALNSLQRSIDMAPTAQAYVARADYRKSSDLAGRRADADAALALEPASSPASILRARTQIDSRDFAGAEATLNKAMAAHGQTPQLLTWRGVVYAKSGQPNPATRDLAIAGVVATQASDLNEMCWNLATAGVALDRALAACDAAVAKDPNDTKIQDSRGFVMLRLRRYADSVTSYDKALRGVGSRAVSLYGRGLARRRNGERDAGDADLKSAIAMDAHVADRYAEYGVKP